VTNAAGESVAIASTGDGLLTTFTNARGDTSHLSYDPLGRLAVDTDAAGGSHSLNRVETFTAFTASVSTALGRTTTYQIEDLGDDAERRVNMFPNGLRSEFLKSADATLSSRSPDGTVMLSTLGGDPRWGLQAPVLSNSVISTPAGLRTIISTTRTSTLSDAKNPLSLTTQTETTSVNGRSYSTAYNVAGRTLVST